CRGITPAFCYTCFIMDQISHILSGDWHHAYLLIGNAENFATDVQALIESRIGTSLMHPDHSFSSYDSFGIDDARLLAGTAAVKSFSGGRKIYMLYVRSITEEAQNALLKLLEEPAGNNHFFIVSPADSFLPTLRSRMYVIDTRTTGGETDTGNLTLPE